MNWLFTEEPTFMMQWQQCDEFARELKKLCKKQKSLESGFKKVQRLLGSYFDPANPNTNAIAPGKIHRISSYVDWDFWKVEVMVIGLKPNLWPRVWFAVHGDVITFLAIAMHSNNYDDNAVEKQALEWFAA